MRTLINGYLFLWTYLITLFLNNLGVEITSIPIGIIGFFCLSFLLGTIICIHKDLKHD